MGGNALKQYNTKRLNREEYDIMTDVVLHQLDSLGIIAQEVQSYRNKQTFGDLDVIVQSESLPPDWVNVIIKKFDLSKNQWSKNSNVLSIGVDNFQIDLIVTPAKYYQSSLDYFAFNDLGNIIGRIGHKLGIKIGHKGLSIVVRAADRSDHILKEIELSQNIADALEILGLDVNRFQKGEIDELEDIFEYVATSKYFDPDIYNLDNRNATSRVRDKKRNTYRELLKWIDDTKPKANHIFKRKSELGGYSLRMPYYETIVLARWPWVKQEVDDVIAKFEFDLRFKEIYNGNVVSKVTSLTGKELGAFMQAIKENLTDDVKQHLLQHPEEVEPMIRNHYDFTLL